MEGLDLDEQLLAIASERLPGVPLHHGNMLDFDLGKRFDVVTCLFSSVAYAGTTENLARAIRAMTDHVAPGGLLVVEPFFNQDQWDVGHLSALFVDEPDLKIARMNLAEPPQDGVVTIEFHYLVGTPRGVEPLTEPHRIALFEPTDYLEAFRAVGLEPEHDRQGLMGRGLYVAVKSD